MDYQICFLCILLIAVTSAPWVCVYLKTLEKFKTPEYEYRNGNINLVNGLNGYGKNYGAGTVGYADIPGNEGVDANGYEYISNGEDVSSISEPVFKPMTKKPGKYDPIIKPIVNEISNVGMPELPPRPMVSNKAMGHPMDMQNVNMSDMNVNGPVEANVVAYDETKLGNFYNDESYDMKNDIKYYYDY